MTEKDILLKVKNKHEFNNIIKITNIVVKEMCSEGRPDLSKLDQLTVYML